MAPGTWPSLISRAIPRVLALLWAGWAAWTAALYVRPVPPQLQHLASIHRCGLGNELILTPVGSGVFG